MSKPHRWGSYIPELSQIFGEMGVWPGQGSSGEMRRDLALMQVEYTSSRTVFEHSD